jgi:VanZ family protein
MHLSRFNSFLLLLAAAVLISAILVFLNPPSDTMIWGAIFDGAHAPVLGMFALAVLISIPSLGILRHHRRGTRYYLAFGITLLFGVLTEGLQYLTGGDAEPTDILRDMIGAAAFLLFAYSFEHRIFQRSASAFYLRSGFRMAAILIFATAYIPTFALLSDYARRNASFPTLFDFQLPWEQTFLRRSNCDVVLKPFPTESGNPSGRLAAYLTFHPATYPGIAVQEPYPDWSGYALLSFRVFSELQVPVAIALRIDDVHHNNEYYDRFNRGLIIMPGENNISIPIAEIRTAPKQREMDIKHIRRFLIFAVNPSKPFSLYLDTIQLQKPATN